jgi:DNA-binding transcriptional ArsR family regulator
MPIDRTPTTIHDRRVIVAPSAVSELSGVECACFNPKPDAFPVPVALAARANRFWGDAYPGLAEIVVLGDATGHLDDVDLDGFLERLRDPVEFAEWPALETESDDERAAVYARLERLASDRRLRTRYVALLRDLWATFAGLWTTEGRARAEAVAALWSARISAGSDVLDLLPAHHIARREPFAAMVHRAQRDGTIRLSPSTSGSGHIIALPGMLSLSADAVADDPAVTRRRVAAEISDRLRALSDPTRLTILTHLAQAPSGVSDLARALHIAQPTASVHLRQLREAGLVTVERQGTRSVYSAAPSAVEGLLADVSEQLARSMRS